MPFPPSYPPSYPLCRCPPYAYEYDEWARPPCCGFVGLATRFM
ncbi:13952_t:CDS:2 [Ambispora leptoticha]|uniref:13952_t:CDS:1 n=1 Tax=Ambispora leptoticha TaxID=144679 RepID=A0A9N8ZQ73_9GLOM|nr:13952_t:CDS:2 [Ambispora leptoticha]